MTSSNVSSVLSTNASIYIVVFISIFTAYAIYHFFQALFQNYFYIYNKKIIVKFNKTNDVKLMGKKKKRITTLNR